MPQPVVEYGARRTLIVVGIMMAALLQTLDATIVNVALPTIEGNIGASIDDGIWIVTGYIISNVVTIPLVPYLLETFGRRGYFATCIIGFTVASFLCGTATSLTTLVLFRVVQGAFGGGLIATSQIVLRSTFPPERVGTSAALFAIALTLGPALGPTLGGLLTDNLAWPWIFDINIVPGAIAAVIVLTMVRNPTPPRRMPFDGAGLALLIVTLGAMQYVLDEGERKDWFDDGGIRSCAVAFALGLAAFIAWELRGARHPIVDLRIFRYRNFRIGVPVALAMGMVIFGPTLLIPQYTQAVLAFTATLSGLLMLMRALPVIVLTPLVARLATRIDVRWLLTAGFAISGTSFAAIALRMTPQSDYGTFAFVLIVSGIGQSMLLVPLLVGLLGALPPADVPKGSSFVSLSVQLGASVASTMLVTVLDRRTSFHSDIFRAHATLGNAGFVALLHRPGGLAFFTRLLQTQSTNAGFADALCILVPLSACAIALAQFLRFPRAKQAPAVVIAGD